MSEAMPGNHPLQQSASWSELLETPEAKSLNEWLQTSEMKVVRRFLEAPDASLLDPDVHWHNPDGSPYGGTFIGPQAVMEGYINRLHSDFEFKGPTIDNVMEAGGYVIALGRLHGRARATEVEVTVPFADFFQVRGGRIVTMEQYTDTRIWAEALAGRVPPKPTPTITDPAPPE
jgi:ketosteroid isomerase-like protein